MTATKLVLALTLAVVAVAVGIFVASSSVGLIDSLLPTDTPDGSLLATLLPVVTSYLIWAAVTIVVFVVGWQLLGRFTRPRR